MYFLYYFNNFSLVGERSLLEVKTKRPAKSNQQQPANSIPQKTKVKTPKKPVASPRPNKQEVKKPQKLNPVHLKRSPQLVTSKNNKIAAKTDTTSQREYIPTYEDHDCDGIPDDRDDDIDNDGLLDRTQDSDWDGLLNHVDEDDDNDGKFCNL